MLKYQPHYLHGLVCVYLARGWYDEAYELGVEALPLHETLKDLGVNSPQALSVRGMQVLLLWQAGRMDEARDKPEASNRNDEGDLAAWRFARYGGDEQESLEEIPGQTGWDEVGNERTAKHKAAAEPVTARVGR